MSDTPPSAPQGAPQPDAPRAGMPGWLRAVLILSLAGNLAVVGVVAGFMLRPPVPSGPGLNLSIDGFRGLHLAMPEDDRARLGGDIRARRDEIRSARQAQKAARAEFILALRADPFDPQQITDVFARQAEVWASIGQTSREVLVARIAQMTPEARAQFADTLETQIKEGRFGHRGDKPPRD